MPGIKDKVVVITGASSGIGEATAIMLAERGAKVVIGARGLDRLQSLARQIERAGGEVAYAQTDVRKREDLTSLVNLACERYGQLDVLAAEFTGNRRVTFADCSICLPIVNDPP